MIRRMISPPSPGESRTEFMRRCQDEGGDQQTCSQLWVDSRGIALPKGIPLRPDPNALHEAAMISVARACLMTARAVNDRVVKNVWDDRTAELLVARAGVSPTTLAGSAALAQLTLHFIASLVPVSAAAAVIARSLQLSF